MKIVKRHKNRSAHSEAFGIWSGKTLSDIEVNPHATCVSHGILADQIVHVQIGQGEAFIWLDDMNEVRRLGVKLIEIADESVRESVRDGVRAGIAGDLQVENQPVDPCKRVGRARRVRGGKQLELGLTTIR